MWQLIRHSQFWPACAIPVALLLGGRVVTAEEPLVPLNVISQGTYQGYIGGLYAEGRNEPWGAYAEALSRVAEQVQPLDREGKPDPQGKIVVAGVGASVCRQIFAELEKQIPTQSGLNPAVVVVNCAAGGQDVNKIADPSQRYWKRAEKALAARGISAPQVQAVWYQSDDLRDQRDDFPGRPQRLKDQFAGQLRLLKQHFPNVRLCYFGARHTTAFMPDKVSKAKHGEPRPYYNGWAVKWLIEEQAAGRADLRFEGEDAVAPLAAWATYFWTDGDKRRTDGYRWTRDDVVADGVHLSEVGRQRVACELLDFWRNDPFARTWFAAAHEAVLPTVSAWTPAKTQAETEPPVATPAERESTQVYKKTDDRNLHMTLTFPSGWRSEDRRSAIIFFYNGGWKASGASRQFSEQAEYFALRGMVCTRADYREKSKEGVTSVKCIEDIHTAIRWLRHSASALGIDPQRIAAAGGSGSIHLLASLLYVKETDAEADDLSTSPHPGTLFLFDSDLDVLDPAMMRQLLAAAESPDTRRRFPPTIIFYGGRDAMKPYMDDFVSKMKKTGMPIDPFVAEDGLHGAFKFSPWLEKTTARMDKQLQTLGFLTAEPRAKLPARSKPEGVDQRILENQARWLKRHKQLEQSRSTLVGKRQSEKLALQSQSAPATTSPATYTYKTLGERKLQLAVHYPPGWKKEDRRSAILFFGGGGMNPKDKSGNSHPLAAERAKLGLPAVNAGPGAAFMSEVKHFAARGLLCVRVEYRKRKTDGTLPSDAVEDAASAMRWVRNNAACLGIDASRIVACGSSSGGHLAASLAALDEFDAAGDDRAISRCPDALILHSPLLDFLDGGTRTTPFLAAVGNDRTLGERLSPARHWRADLPPTLIFSGTKEPIFDALREFAAKWKTAGENMDFVAVEGGHVSSLADKSLAQTLTRMEVFLKSVGCWEPSPVGLNSTTATISTPRVRSDASPDEPAWFINGKNKMPKLLRLLGTMENVRVIVFDLEDEQVAEIRDVLHRYTDLNELVGPGRYRLKFLDKSGKPIRLTQEVADVLQLK